MKIRKSPYALLLPQVVLSLIFIAGILNAWVQSLGIIPSLGLNTPSLDYYRVLFTRGDFLSSLLFSLYIALVSSLLSVVIGVFFCALLIRFKKTRGLPLRIVQLPIITPHVIVAFFILHFLSQNGMFARLFYHLGWIEAQTDFPLILFDKNGIGIILAYLWKEVPFIVYFVMALMAGIDEKLGEAAVNLGASRIKTFFRITLPLSLPTISGGFLILFTYALGAFELPFILGATEPKVLPIWAYIQYSHPDLHNRPYAMAVNVIIVLICMLAVFAHYLLNQAFKKSLSSSAGKEPEID